MPKNLFLILIKIYITFDSKKKKNPYFAVAITHIEFNHSLQFYEQYSVFNNINMSHILTEYRHLVYNSIVVDETK